jgi:uncharacterized Ntn-hydrolase superfamily protein
VARDARSGQLGVAAQSCYFALGRVLPWARAGVGAVATQSMVDPGYGPRCLDLLAEGMEVATALEQVRAADPGRDVRQVGVVDVAGHVAAFTGSRCVDHVGQASGAGYSVQANMMRGPGVCEAMAAAFEGADGSLARRMMAALVAAEEAGGDGRGRMSAALLVVQGERARDPWEGAVIDVRVDHHPDPLGELARLVQVAEAYQLSDVAQGALLRGDNEDALAGMEAGLTLLPDEGNFMLGYMVALVRLGNVDQAARELRQLIAREPGWEGVLRAREAQGLLPLPEDFGLDTLLAWPVDA